MWRVWEGLRFKGLRRRVEASNPRVFSKLPLTLAVALNQLPVELRDKKTASFHFNYEGSTWPLSHPLLVMSMAEILSPKPSTLKP